VSLEVDSEVKEVADIQQGIMISMMVEEGEEDMAISIGVEGISINNLQEDNNMETGLLLREEEIEIE